MAIAMTMVLGVLTLPAQDQQAKPGVFGIDPADDTPLVERQPFDRIRLNEMGDNATLYVQPLGLEGPIDTSQPGFLKFEILDRPDKLYVVPWRAIASIERYDEIVIAETRQAFQSGDFDTAFRNLLYMFDARGDSDPVVKELLRPFWYFDARHLLEKGNYELALSVFEELYRRDPSFTQPGQTQPLADVIANCYDHILNQLANAGDFEALQAKLADIRQKYKRPDTGIGRLIQKWDDMLGQRLQSLVASLVKAAADPNPIIANDAVRRLTFSAPSNPQTWQVFNQVIENHPMIVVGISETAAKPDAGSIDNWAARRVGRLIQRQLISLRGLGDDGGLYEFEEGRVVPVDEFGRAFQFEIIDDSNRFTSPIMSAYELAQRLASLINERSPHFYFPLAKLITSIEIVDDQHVEITLNRPYARIESLLRVPNGESPKENKGRYQRREDLTAGLANAQAFGPNADLVRDDDGQYPLIVERQFPNASQAAAALLRGEIDVLDRVFPADLYRLRDDPQIAIRAYLIPTVHLLVPNPRTEFMKDQMFRRGLLYAIDRKRIVKQLICGGQEINGFEALSGPFPIGTEENDLIGYGYDSRVPVTEFDARMAIVSPAVVLDKMHKAAAERLKTERQSELTGLDEDQIFKQIEAWIAADASLAVPKLVLAHPATDVAITACQNMVQMWGAVGIQVELRALPPGESVPADDDYDLLYVESTVEEPLADARRLFGDLGLIKNINPSIEQLLTELDLAKNWVEARSILRQMHEQCQYDLIALPLWQTINYYAYRRNIRGIEAGLIHLYEDADQWRITLPNQETP